MWLSQICPPFKVVVVVAAAAAVVEVAAAAGDPATTKKINVWHRAALLISFAVF